MRDLREGGGSEKGGRGGEKREEGDEGERNGGSKREEGISYIYCLQSPHLHTFFIASQVFLTINTVKTHLKLEGCKSGTNSNFLAATRICNIIYLIIRELSESCISTNGHPL